MRDEEVREVRVVRPIAAVAGGFDRRDRRGAAADCLHVVGEVHDAHRQRDLLTFGVGGVAVAVPTLVGEAKRGSNVGPKIEPLDQHVAHFAAGGEVVDRPGVGLGQQRLGDRGMLGGWMAGGRRRHHRPPDIGRIARVHHERLGEDREVVPEHG